MTNILVICGAGASSSFLVHWLRKQATARGLDLTFAAGSLEGLPAELGAADAVLVGSHLADAFDSVHAASAEVRTPALLLPTVSFDAAGADIALDLFLESHTERTTHA